MLVIHAMKVEFADCPHAIDVKQPRFTWTLMDEKRASVQTACRIRVYESALPLRQQSVECWDSGVVDGDMLTLLYAGKPLQSNRIYYWQLDVWGNGQERPSSRTAHFATTLLDQGEWTAQWIGDNETELRLPEANTPEQVTEYDPRSVLFRQEVRVSRSVWRATAYICGLGMYEWFIDGNRVGDRVMAPLHTDYLSRCLYDVYDVTGCLQEGGHAVGIHLGNGWFHPKPDYLGFRMQWFGTPRVILQICLEYEDGSMEWLNTDHSWRTAKGPVLHSCIYDGEACDARLEPQGWTLVGHPDGNWPNAVEVQAPYGGLQANRYPPVKVIEELAPVRIWSTGENRYVADLGQNFAGWIRLYASGAEGTEITLRYAENVTEELQLDTRTNRRAAATDTFILRGGGKEVLEPRFTYHGFRYVEICGYPGELTADDIMGRVVHSAVEPIGAFACDNPLINHVHACTMWTYRSSMQGLPVDCPQRDERLGWLGDAKVTAEMGLMNYDTVLFYEKWLDDILTESSTEHNGDIPHLSPRPKHMEGSPEWSGCYHLIVWYLYEKTGDLRLLDKHYGRMTGYVDYLSTTAQEHILPKGRYGDWLSIEEGWVRGDPELTTTAFYYMTADICERTAALLEKKDDVRRMAALKERIFNAYQQRYYDPRRFSYSDHTLSANVISLYFGLVPAALEEKVWETVLRTMEDSDYRLQTGILATKYVFDLLSRFQRPDIAYRILTQTDYPSWEYMLRGRTTLTEIWNPEQGSNNHVMFGSVDLWLYRGLAGLQWKAGTNIHRLAPYMPEGMNHLSASTETAYGKLALSWQRRPSHICLTAEIPANAVGQLVIPFAPADIDYIEEEGSTVWSPGSKTATNGSGDGPKAGERIEMALKSGIYHFILHLKQR